MDLKVTSLFTDMWSTHIMSHKILSKWIFKATLMKENKNKCQPTENIYFCLLGALDALLHPLHKFWTSHQKARIIFFNHQLLPVGSSSNLQDFREFLLCRHGFTEEYDISGPFPHPYSLVLLHAVHRCFHATVKPQLSPHLPHFIKNGKPYTFPRMTNTPQSGITAGNRAPPSYT